MATLTGASAIITIVIPQLFPTPVQLQGFAADDVYDMDSIEVAETLMGVDGRLSGGFVWKEIKQNFSLQADSASNALFENWYAAQVTGLDAFTAEGRTNIRATGQTYISTRGFLTTYTPAPSVGKLLKPRKYSVTWQNIQSVPN